MRSVEDQLAMVVDAAVTPAPVRVAIGDALGLMCAEEITATRPLPGFNQAAVDGYAVRAVDVGGATGLFGASRTAQVGDTNSTDSTDNVDGVAGGDDDDAGADLHPSEVEPGQQSQTEQALPVVGEVAAGSQRPLRLQPKQAVRVATGAPLPTLADAVLPLEWTDRGRKRVTAHQAVRSGDFVRRPGDDIQPGDVAVRQGAVFGPAQVGLVAAAGRQNVLVHPRPRVTVMSYGLELVDVDRDPELGQVIDIASYVVAAALTEAGAQTYRAGIINAEPRGLHEVIAGHVARSELVVLCGAVGGSGADAVQEVLRELGEIDTTRVAMHPGSVQGFGLLGEERIPAFLLPANPVSALVVAETMIRPAIRKSLGKSATGRRSVRARSLRAINSIHGRRGFVRARLMRDAETGDYLVESLGNGTGRPAHLLAGFAEANAMISVPEDVTHIRPGDVVEVEFMQQRS